MDMQYLPHFFHGILCQLISKAVVEEASFMDTTPSLLAVFRGNMGLFCSLSKVMDEKNLPLAPTESFWTGGYIRALQKAT